MLPLLVSLFMPVAEARDLDLVFLLDTTGSMSAEIRESKERVRQIATSLQVARPQDRLRLGVVAYRDRNDDYLSLVQPLSDNIDEVFGFLARLEAGGGGDSPEDVLSGMHAVIEQMAWAPGSERQVFVIGDAPPHLDYDGPSLDQLVQRARDEQVVFNTIGCRSLSGSGIDAFRRIAYETEGRYQHIGRVQTDDAGLAQAMLSTLATEPPKGEPFAMRVSSTAPAPAEARPADSGVLLRRGTWWSAVEKGPDAGGCLVTLMLPEGLSLAGEPSGSLSEAGLRVGLRLRPGDGGLWTLEPERCLPATTPLIAQVTE